MCADDARATVQPLVRQSSRPDSRGWGVAEPNMPPPSNSHISNRAESSLSASAAPQVMLCHLIGSDAICGSVLRFNGDPYDRYRQTCAWPRTVASSCLRSCARRWDWQGTPSSSPRWRATRSGSPPVRHHALRAQDLYHQLGRSAAQHGTTSLPIDARRRQRGMTCQRRTSMRGRAATRGDVGRPRRLCRSRIPAQGVGRGGSAAPCRQCGHLHGEPAGGGQGTGAGRHERRRGRPR